MKFPKDLINKFLSF